MGNNKKKTRDLMRSRPKEFRKEQFIRDVCHDKYILILGGEVVLDKEKFSEEDGNVDNYILSALNNSLKSDYTTLSALVTSRPSHSTEDSPSGADMIRNLVLPEKDEDGTLDYFIDLEDLAQELDGMLRSQMFRFVMTTTIDNCVERLMYDIWGRRLRVVNIADSNDWIQFQKELASTIDRSDPTKTVYNYDRPTLVYIFGKVAEDTSKSFVKTENDAIEFIVKWMNTNDSVIKYISEKRILALGCKFADWYFRFFWYIFKRDFDKLGEGEVAISLDDHITSEHSLKEYLERKSIYIHPDARKFMADINLMLSPESYSPQSAEFHDIILGRRGNGNIFLSYCSRDFSLASRLFLQLTNLGYHVWFDHQSLCGGNYELLINDAINNAAVVLTLLTPTIANDLKSGSTNHYYYKEWQYAAQTDKERIIPVAANGYNMFDDIHCAKYESVVGKRNGVDLMTDGLNKLVKVIDNISNK